MTKTQVTLGNSITKKLIPIQGIKNSPNDLRVILITLENKMELDATYELTLQKVTALDGVELPAENRIPLKVVYGGAFPSLDTLSPDIVPTDTPITGDVAVEPAFTEPVPIDTLPHTGPR